MSQANKKAAIYFVATILIFLGTVAKPLGIPELWGAMLAIAGGLMLLLVVSLQKKEKAERKRMGQPAPVAPLAARKKLFWITAFSLIAGSFGMLPLLPYTVDNFQPWIYYWVIPAQIVFLVLFLPFLWKKWTGIDRRS